jgi:hypothetical protein
VAGPNRWLADGLRQNILCCAELLFPDAPERQLRSLTTTHRYSTATKPRLLNTSNAPSRRPPPPPPPHLQSLHLCPSSLDRCTPFNPNNYPLEIAHVLSRDGSSMTSRPFLGQRQPPPRRSLSTTNVIQRPPQHRTLSQQFPSSSPTRRSTDGFADLTFDGTDAAQGRYGTIPRMGGSRLKLEISDTSNHEFIESPKAMTANTPTWRPNVTPHARSQLHFEIPNVSHLSPRAAQDGSNEEPAIKPMPLPIRPGQHAPPSSRKARPIATNTVKKDVRPKPYTLEVPAAAPRFPPNGKLTWTEHYVIYANNCLKVMWISFLGQEIIPKINSQAI